MSKFAKTDCVQSAKSELPEQTYRVRITGTELGKSQKGHEMTTLSLEVISPETVIANGQEIPAAGRPFKLFLMHVPGESWGQAQVFDFCTKLQLDLNDEYDTAHHKEYFLGMEFDMILRTEESIKKFSVGENKGKPILDGEGNKISDGFQIKASLGDVLPLCNPVRNETVAF